MTDNTEFRGDYYSSHKASLDITRDPSRGRDFDSLAVVLPTYNERAAVGDVIRKLLQYGCVQEVIVVDDDSPDRTWKFVREAFDDPVRCIRRTEESGLSSAVLRGFEATDAPVLAAIDADGQHPPDIVPALAEQIDSGADLAIGSRHAGGSINSDWSLDRHAMSFGASLISWLAIPDARLLQDPMSGCFAARGAAVRAVLDRLNPEGYKILLEVLAQAPIDEVVEVPMRFDQREAGESGLDGGEIVNYLKHMARLARTSRARRRPTRSRADISELKS